MKPSLEALATFVAVVEAGGLSPAARRLSLAKSVVSKRLADLEAAAGAELIRRTTRRNQPTEAGTAFYAHAKRILAELDTALEEAAGVEGELGGPFRVAVPLTFGRMFLAEIFFEFARTHPRVALTLDCDDRRIDIAGGGYDLGIRIGQLSDSALIARRLAPSRQLLVASPAYLDAHGAPAGIEDLQAHRCITYANAAMAHQWRFAGGSEGEGRSIAVRPVLTANSGEIMRGAAIAGLGVAPLPVFIVAEALRDGRLVRVLPHECLESGAIYAVWPPRSAPSRKLRAMVDLLAVRVPERLTAAGAWPDPERDCDQ